MFIVQDSKIREYCHYSCSCFLLSGKKAHCKCLEAHCTRKNVDPRTV